MAGDVNHGASEPGASPDPLDKNGDDVLIDSKILEVILPS